MEFHGLQVEMGGHVVHIPFTTCWQLFNDFYETTEHACLPLIYEAGDRVLDSGAGIGYITREIAYLADFVLGIEALPEYAEVGRLNTQGVENAFIIDGAIGLAHQPVTFHQRYLAYASSVYDQTIAHDPVEKTIEVQGLSINDLIAGYGINCLHLDLEGYEVELLEGTDLSRIEKVTLETHQYVYGPDGTARIMAALFRGGLIPLLVNRPNVSVDGQDTFVMSWARPAIVARKQREPIGHRTIRWAELELKLMPKKEDERTGGQEEMRKADG